MTKELGYHIIEPARFKLDGGAMYGIIPKPLWNKVHPADESNRVDLALRLWVIRSEEKVVVVDTGIGDYHDDKFNKLFDVRSDQGPIEQALSKLSLTCDDVTDLVLTHLHFDHVGGIGVKVKDKDKQDQWQPTFKNAKLHLHKSHHHYAHNATARDRGSFHTQNFDPIIKYYKDSDALYFYEGEEGELFSLGRESQETLRFKCSHGHTPWLMHPYTSEFIYLADLIPTSNHIHIPWVMGYDIAPGVTTQDKEKFLSFIEQRNLKLIFEHDPNYWGSQLIRDEKGRLSAGDKFPCPHELAYTI